MVYEDKLSEREARNGVSSVVCSYSFLDLFIVERRSMPLS
jgi:hypothetical protein